MPRTSIIAAAVLLSVPATAHDFWIDLRAYRLAAGADIPARLLIGDLAAVEAWNTQWPRVASLRDYGPTGVRDLQAGIRTTTGSDSGGATLALADAEPGTHVIAFESNLAENDIAAAEFNAYAQHEGLTPALDQRRRTGTSNARGRELYARRAKALVQIGAAPTANDTRAIGQTLELVPETSPYALGADEPLVLRVEWHGRPLAGASVVLESLDTPGAHGVPVLSDAAGHARFRFDHKGRWRANVVWTEPIVHPRAEFQTIFCSLTFGY